jgi:hypothetical protein
VKTLAQMDAAIDRFRTAFWKRCAGRPPIGVAPSRSWLPISYLQNSDKLPLYLQPGEIDGLGVSSDYADAARDRRVFIDDWVPYTAAWRAVPWLEAMCGCPVRCASGSLAPEHCVANVSLLEAWPIPAAPVWQQEMATQTSCLVRNSPEDCLVSPTILRGPADVLAAMLGLTEFYLALHDAPSVLAATAARINALQLATLLDHFSRVPARRAGYGHIYGYWSPSPSTVIQDDVLGMCAPKVFREHYQELSASLVRDFPGSVFYHLHSTGIRHINDVLAIPGLAGVELTLEGTGPTLSELLPLILRILEQTRLILFVDHGFEELPEALKVLPHDGLYVIVSDQDVTDADSYATLLHRSNLA